MTKLEIGKIRRRLTLEIPQRLPDALGGVAITWTAIADLWAQIEPTSGAETVVAEGLSGHVTHIVTMRFRLDVVPGAQLRLAARVFRIHAVLDDGERHRVLKVYCQERGL